MQVISPLAWSGAGGHGSTLLDGTAVGGTQLVQGAAAALSDLYQHFGVVEASQLTLDGQVNLASWLPASRDRVRTWAQRVGVGMT
ncbi:hypothetical protein AB5J72_49845 [Streptomyces sp. CG1]|uniref:hypothetical protein n=1 Tax=Streptomyces sp. CG1 TaxID=1287523 RepID=UPI0034E2ED48